MRTKILGELDSSAVETLDHLCVSRRFDTNDIIYFPGEEREKLYLLQSGAVKLYQLLDGHKIVIRVLADGEFFGDTSLGQTEHHVLSENYAEAALPTTVCVLQRSDFGVLVERNPEFAQAVLASVHNQLVEAENKIKDLAVASVQDRLINELIRYARRHGQKVGGYYQINERLSHQSLADMTGVARETATKTLAVLRKLGLIEMTSKRFIRINVIILEQGGTS